MPGPIFDDPVVAEIHATRARMLADCNGDIEQLMRQVATRQRASGHPVIMTPFRKRTEQSGQPEPPKTRGVES
jgi:hypothetical protein